MRALWLVCLLRRQILYTDLQELISRTAPSLTMVPRRLQLRGECLTWLSRYFSSFVPPLVVVHSSEVCSPGQRKS
jgi:hypothetical protein